jgi:uncharacterized protein (DUF488 family)
MTLYTLGYGNRRYDAIAALIPAGAVVIDIRERSWCTWSKDWHKGTLTARLGRRYRHIAALGNTSGCAYVWRPPHGEDAARQHLQLLAHELRAGSVLVLLCAEGKHENCHRTLVAKGLQEMVEGLEVVHL